MDSLDDSQKLEYKQYREPFKTYNEVESLRLGKILYEEGH